VKFKPTLEIAENSIKQFVVEYNERFTEELTAEDLVLLKQKYEKLYKSYNEDYLENFKMYTIIDIALIVMEALSIDRILKFSLSNEEIKIAAQELYERWV